MRTRHALLAGALSLFAAVLARADGAIGIIKTYDPAKKAGLLVWEGGETAGTEVPYLLDDASPVVRPGDRVYAFARPVKSAGRPQAPAESYLMNLYVTGLVTPDPARPAPKPAPKPKPAPAYPVGVVKSFDPATGVGVLVPDGQSKGREFRMWPGAEFKPSVGTRLWYSEDEQFGEKILWAAPPQPAPAQ